MTLKKIMHHVTFPFPVIKILKVNLELPSYQIAAQFLPTTLFFFQAPFY